MDSILAFSNGRLDPVLQFLPPSSLITIAITAPSYLKSVQLFLANVKKNCTKINTKKITPKMMDNCIFEISKRSLHLKPSRNIMKIIKCVNNRYYGWIIAGKYMALTNGKPRHYPEWFSYGGYGGYGVLHNFHWPILRVIPYKVFQE